MNIEKLKAAEQRFFEQYPEGFDDPELISISKKHKLSKMTEFCREKFKKEDFSNPVLIVENMIKLVSRSSLVSVFEKPKFRDYANSLTLSDKSALSEGLFQMLHGNQKLGLEEMVKILSKAKLAKWTLITVIPAYYKPDYEVFIKPTTVKNIINYFEIEDIKYKPLPSYDFYERFRDYINEMKSHVDESLCVSNPQFTGFLMLAMQRG